MPKRLMPVVKECREALEKEILTHTRPSALLNQSAQAIDRYVHETALDLFLEMAILRCRELREAKQFFPCLQKLSWETLYPRLRESRQVLQGCIPLQLQWPDLCLCSLSEHVLKTLHHHLNESISSDEWNDDHILGWLYESFQAESSASKQHGRFYTPEEVTSAIVDQAFELWSHTNPADDASSPRVLDLGCGCGAFTLKVVEKLFRRYQDSDAVIPHLPAHLLAQHVFLIDNDPRACQLAAISLVFQARRLNSRTQIQHLNIACADALERWEQQSPGLRNRTQRPFLAGYCDAGQLAGQLFTRPYDLVIGNPPYRVVNQLHTAKALIQQYKSYHSAAYKINIFPLFIERGIEMLKPRGILGMVVPNTFLTQMYFEPLRRYILQTCKVLRIVDTKRVFDHAFVENCLLFLEHEARTGRRSAHQIECVVVARRGKRPALLLEQPPHGIAHIAQRHFERAPGMIFRIQLHERVFELSEQIAHDTVPLGEVCESHDGVNPGNARQKLIIAEDAKALCQTDTCKKVLHGKNIGRYWLRWDGLYVRYDRSLLTQGDNVRWGHREALDSAKILTRQTADRVIGTFDRGEYYVTNSVHTTVLRKGIQELSLKYVLALLNSRLLSFYYRMLFPEVGQVFSQVKLVNLRQLPLKILPWHQQADVIDLVEQLLTIVPETLPAGTSGEDVKGQTTCGTSITTKMLKQHEQNLAQIRELDERLDRLIYAAYGLSAEQIELVEQEFSPRK